ncbi:MAG: ABC transporter substrate-binding protein [candidate division KSB1 bacterium]
MAQEAGLPRNQIVIVGRLVGQDDPRQLTIQINDNIFPLEGGAPDRPFEFIKRSGQLFSVMFQVPANENRAPTPTSLDLRPRGVDFRFFSTERSLISAILLEEIDYANLDTETAAEDIQKATTSYQIKPVEPESNTVEMICYNFAHPLLRERAVRHALSYAVNREKMIRQFLQNHADLARGAFEKESRFFASGLKDFGYNPKRALTLLEETGWRAPNRERMRTRNGQPLRFRLLFQEGLILKEQIVRQIKIDWNQIGVDVIPIPVSAAALHDSLRRGRFEAALVRNRFVETMPSLIDFFGDGSGKGGFGYVNPGVLHTANLSKKLLQENEVRQVALRMQALMSEDQIATFLFHPWLTIHIINAAKFEDYITSEGLRPYHQWVIRRNP